jgi:hypothetical protein
MGNGLASKKSDVVFWIALIFYVGFVVIWILLGKVDLHVFQKEMSLSASRFIISGPVIIILSYVWDVITPGGFFVKIEEDPRACAYVVSAFIIALAMCSA